MKNVFLLLCISISLLLPSQNLSEPIPIDSDVKIGVLDNGLKYYIRHNGYPENKVELRLGINAGSVLENDQQRGLAHFMEHMNFNGTTHFPKNKLIDYLQSIGVEFGADLNAYTSFNETVYMLPIPLDKPDNLDNGLLVIEDWAFNALLTDEDINEERGVILEEKRLRGGASMRMIEQWLPIAYKDSRYAERLPIGTEEVLKNFNPDVLRQFKTDWYRPDLMTVVVVGDIDVDQIESKIKANFGKYKNPANEKTRDYYSIPNYSSPNIAIASDPEATGTSAQINYFNPDLQPPAKTVGDYKKEIVNRLFSSMLNSRYQELANGDNPPFNYAYSYYGGTFSESKKAFTSVVSSTPENLSQAFDVLLQENQRVKEHGFVESELERAKAELLSGIEKQYNNRDKIESSNWVRQYLNNYLEEEPIPSLTWEFEHYKKLLPTIQLQDVNALIDTFIQKENYSVIITGPEKPMDVAQVQNSIQQTQMAKLDPYVDDAAGLALMTDIPKPGKIGKTTTLKELDTHTFELSNGVTVTYKKTNYKNDEILFRAYSNGGYSLMSNDDWAKTHFAMGGVTEAGVNGLSNTDMDKVLAGKNVRVSPYISNLTEGMSGNSSIKDLETLFQLVHLYFTQLNFNENAYASFQQKQEGMYGSLINNPEYFFYNEFKKFTNQKNPRNGNIFPLESDWEIASYSLAYEKFKERFANPADFHFYFVGSIEEEQIKKLAAQYLGSLQTNKSRENYKDLAYAPLLGTEDFLLKKGTDPSKALVIMDYETRTPYNKKEDMAMDLLGEILSIKLIEVLREDEGGVYSVRANGGISRGVNSSASLSAQIPTGLEQYEKMESLTVAEIDKIKNNGPTIEDLNKVIETKITHYKEDIQTNRYWLNTLYNADFYKENPAEALKYEEFVRGFTQKDIQNVANKYVKDNLAIGTLIPEKVEEVVVEEVVAVDMENVDVSAMEVINQYLSAITQGKEADAARKELQAIQEMNQKGQIEFNGMKFPVNTTNIAPNTSTMEMDMTKMGGGKMKTFISPTDHYMEMNGDRKNMPLSDEIAYTKGIFNQAFYTEEDVEFVGAEQVDGQTFYIIQYKPTQSKEYYNSNTFLLEKTINTEGEEQRYSNYTATQGILIPMSVSISGGTQDAKISIETVTFK